MNDKRLIFEAYLGQKQKNIYFCWIKTSRENVRSADEWAIAIAKSEGEAIAMYTKRKSYFDKTQTFAYKIGVANIGLPSKCLTLGAALSYMYNMSKYLKEPEVLGNKIFFVTYRYYSGGGIPYEFLIAPNTEIHNQDQKERFSAMFYCLGVANLDIPYGSINMRVIPRNWEEISKRFHKDEDRQDASNMLDTLD